jgi:hypothetical protein
MCKFCFSNIGLYEYKQVPVLEILYVKILKQIIILIKSEYGNARLGYLPEIYRQGLPN